VEVVQDLGVLHVDQARPSDESIAPRELDVQDQAARSALDTLRTRAEGILALLPVIEVPPVDTTGYAGMSADVMRDRIAPVETVAQALTKRLLGAEEEQELLRAYGRALEVLTPLLALLEKGRFVEAAGFVTDATTPDALAALRAELDKAAEGGVE